MIIKRDGKFYRQETVERVISEAEALQERIRELEERIEEVARKQHDHLPEPYRSPVTYPNTTPSNIDGPIWYYDPSLVTFRM